VHEPRAHSGTTLSPWLKAQAGPAPLPSCSAGGLLVRESTYPATAVTEFRRARAIDDGVAVLMLKLWWDECR